MSDAQGARGHVAVAGDYQRRRLWTTALVALGLVVVQPEIPEPRLLWPVVLTIALVAVHAVWRLSRPGGSDLDSILIDGSAMLLFLAAVRPPGGVLATSLLITVIPAWLFLPTKAMSWVVSYQLLGVAAVTWVFGPPGGDGRADAFLAVVLVLATLPILAWLIRQLSSTLSEGRHLAGRLDETAARFEDLFQGSVVPMFRSTFDGALLDANPALLTLFGAQDVASMQADGLLARYADPGRRLDLLLRLDREREVRGLEATLLRLDGTEFCARISARLTRVDAADVIEGVLEDVSEQRQAEREARLAALVLEEMPTAVVIADTDGLVSHWNPAAEKVFGVAREQALGRPARQLLLPSDLESEAAALRALERRGSWAGEIEVRGPDSPPIPVLASITRLNGRVGRYGTAMAFSDMRDLHRARRGLRFQSKLLEQVHNAVIATDLTGKVIFWNPAAERMYGWRASEALGRNILDVNVPASEREAAEEILESLRTTGVWEGEFEVLRRDGSEFTAWVSDSMLHDERGVPIGVVGVSSDLTERKQAEAEARRQGDLARAVLESVHVPLAVVGEGERVLAVNRSWTSFAGRQGPPWDRVEAGTTLEEIVGILPSNGPRALEAFAGLEAVLSGKHAGFSMEYVHEGPDGERWYRLEVSPVPGTGAVVAHWDITDERLARATLENIIRAKDEFIASVSHELRSPLSVVVGLSQELRDGRIPGEEAAELQGMLAEQALEVAFLVEDLLVAARVDSDAITVAHSPVDLESEVRSVLGALEPLTAGIEVSGHPRPGLGDPLRVRQVVRNLVHNAFRHGAAPVSIQLGEEPGAVFVEVRDHGEGIPRESLDRLFTPYARFHHKGGQPTSIGLGLHVSRRLATLMAGRLEYRREADVTCFTLTLPAAAVEAQASMDRLSTAAAS